MATASAVLRVPSFAAMLRIWVLTVSGDRCSRFAMLRRSSPLTMSLSTSRSLSVSSAKSCPSGSETSLSDAASITVSRPEGNQVPPSMAARTAVTTCWAGPFLDTKPIAPAWTAPIAVAASEKAVRTTTTGGLGRAVSWLVRSMPLTSPSCTSMTTASGFCAATMLTTWSGLVAAGMGSKSGSARKTASRPSAKTR